MIDKKLFIEAWKKAANHKRNKRIKYICDHVQYFWYNPTEAEIEDWKAKGYIVKGFRYIIPNGGYCYTKPWLTGAHFILRNYILEKPLDYGFVPRKITESEDPMQGFQNSLWFLSHYIIRARKYLKLINDIEFKKEWLSVRGRTEESLEKFLRDNYLDGIQKFLEPFGGIITLEDLAEINLDI